MRRPTTRCTHFGCTRQVTTQCGKCGQHFCSIQHEQEHEHDEREHSDKFVWLYYLAITKVCGEQARQATRLDLIKITQNSAEQLLHLGYEIIIVGNRVNIFHFFGGWRLAHIIKLDTLKDYSFDSYVKNFEFYLERELGKAAFFVYSNSLNKAINDSKDLKRDVLQFDHLLDK